MITTRSRLARKLRARRVPRMRPSFIVVFLFQSAVEAAIFLGYNPYC
jgi:hypothetical protein